MARLQLVGGPRDGDFVNCCMVPECECSEWGHGHSGASSIQDGFIAWQMYRRDGKTLVPSHIKKQTMIASGFCPRCNRAMPEDCVNCKNCGAEMDPLGWNEQGNN